MYDLFARVYDRFFALHATDKQGVLRDILARQTAAGPGDRVLDICTGTGPILPSLADRVGQAGLVAGLDFPRGDQAVPQTEQTVFDDGARGARKPVCQAPPLYTAHVHGP